MGLLGLRVTVRAQMTVCAVFSPAGGHVHVCAVSGSTFLSMPWGSPAHPTGEEPEAQ